MHPLTSGHSEGPLSNVFRGFTLSFQADVGKDLKLGLRCFHPPPFSPLINRHISQRYIMQVVEITPLNKPRINQSTKNKVLRLLLYFHSSQ
jgi:hypothetical protein